MPFRPTDWTGTKNSFIEERLLSSNDPENRVIILEHKPFFSGLKVLRVGTTTPLVRGTDYELVYELPELEGVAYDKLFCGVNIINPAIGGTLRFEGNEVSGEFRGPFIEILDKLVKYVNTPPDLEWLNVDDRPPLVPQEKSANSWYDYLNKKYIASAIRDVNISSDDANAELGQKLEALRQLVTDLQAEITAFNYKAHIDDPLAHQTTVAQTGTHPITRDAPRSMMAYGRTLLELIRDIRSQGLQQSDIDRYIAHYAHGDVTGTFVQELSANRALFKSSDNNSEVVFTSTEFTIRSKGTVILSASTDLDDRLRFIEWRSGNNKLRIESSGNKIGMDKIILNDRVLLNTYSVLDYQATDGGGGSNPDDNRLYIEGRNGISFAGKGSKADPVVGSFKTTKATKAVAGAVKLKTGPGPEVDGYGSTPASLTPFLNKLKDFVPKSTRLNGVPMDDGSRTITKATLGLTAAENTADLDKKLSTAQSGALAGLSPSDHTHDWGGLSILPANHNMAGITKYAKSIDGAAPNKGIVPNVLLELSSRLDVLGEIFNAIDTTAATDFSIIDKSSWTVTSTKRSLTVKDMRYFYLLNNKRKEGHVSGTIDLETTPMFRWFSPENRMERTWPAAITRSVTGVSWDQVPAEERPPLAFRGEPIALQDYEFGSLSIVSLLSKFVVVPASNRLVFYVVGGGNITLYVDGQETLSANKVLGGVVTVTPGVPVCIGMRVDCNDPAVSAAVMYEVYDGAIPVVVSKPGDKLAKLQEFVITPYDIKHYLYLNMDTNALFSRAEPIKADEIDVRYSLIGYVHVPPAGLVGPIEFEKQMDFGQSVEVVKHVDNPLAHKDAGEYRIVDSIVEPLGKMHFLINYTAVGNVTVKPAFEGMFDCSQAANADIEIFAKVEGQSPYYWFTPKNPKASFHPTIEGGLFVESNTTSDTTIETVEAYELAFGGKAFGSGVGAHAAIVVPLKKATAVTFRRHDGLGQTATLGSLGKLATVATSVVPTVVREETTTDLSLLELSPVAAPNNRMLLKYRYDVSLNTLRVYTARYLAGESAIRILELEYKFNFDAFTFMGGYVSLKVPKTVSGGVTSMLPTPVVFKHSSFDINKYAYFRALFESYVDSKTMTPKCQVSTASGYQTTGFEQYSEVIVTPLSGGFVSDSSTMRLPIRYRPEFGRYPLLSLTPVPTTKWRNPVSMADGASKRLGGTIGAVAAIIKTNGQYNVGKVVAKYTTYDAGKLTFVSRKVGASPVMTLTAQAQSATPSVTTTEYTMPLAAGLGVCTMLLSFTTATNGLLNDPARCNFSIEVYDSAGVLKETFTDADSYQLYSLGNRGEIFRCNPYHMTAVVWDETKTIMAQERNNAKLGFGDW